MTATIDTIEQYLQQLAKGRENQSVPGYVLQHGRAFASEKLTPAEREFVELIQWEQRKAKACWYNSQMEYLTLPPTPGITLKYVEGYVDPSLGPVLEHAWLSVNGKVVDPTLKNRANQERIIGTIPEGWQYFGVEMEPQACEHVLVYGHSTPLIDDVDCGWPLIPKRRANRRGKETKTA